jgi:hypothetical protein
LPATGDQAGGVESGGELEVVPREQVLVGQDRAASIPTICSSVSRTSSSSWAGTAIVERQRSQSAYSWRCARVSS